MALAAPFPAARPVRASAPRTSGLRLTRRGRVVAFLASVFLLGVVIVLSGRVTADAGTSSVARMSGPVAESVVVKPGENLWQIAKRVAPGSDPRETVLRLRELNGLDDSKVVAGQSLIVPTS